MRSRLSIVENVYFHEANAQPTGTTKRCQRELATDDLPYGPRKLLVSEEWQPIDTGWLDMPSMLLLENLAGTFLQRIPTPEERAATAEKIVEVGCDGAAFSLVHPACIERITPATGLSVRCRRGETSLLVTAYPR